MKNETKIMEGTMQSKVLKQKKVLYDFRCKDMRAYCVYYSSDSQYFIRIVVVFSLARKSCQLVDGREESKKSNGLICATIATE